MTPIVAVPAATGPGVPSLRGALVLQAASTPLPPFGGRRRLPVTRSAA